MMIVMMLKVGHLETGPGYEHSSVWPASPPSPGQFTLKSVSRLILLPAALSMVHCQGD